MLQPKPSSKGKMLSLRIDPDLVEALRLACAWSHKSVTDVVGEVLRDGLYSWMKKTKAAQSKVEPDAEARFQNLRIPDLPNHHDNGGTSRLPAKRNKKSTLAASVGERPNVGQALG